MPTPTDCLPPAVNGACPAVVAPASTGQGVCTLTLDNPNFRQLLGTYARRLESHAALVALRKTFDSSSPEWDALWYGSQALDDWLDQRVRLLRDNGCLLHVGMVA